MSGRETGGVFGRVLVREESADDLVVVQVAVGLSVVAHHPLRRLDRGFSAAIARWMVGGGQPMPDAP